MPNFTLDHVQMAIPEGQEDHARQFWGDAVGLAEIEKPKALRARGGVWFALVGAELHLGVEAAFSPAKKAHPGIRVADLDALAENLERHGHEVLYDDAITGRKRFFTDDPFGNRIEFLQA